MKKLLFFHAPWCPPCRLVELEVVTPLEQEIGSEKIQRINAQNEPFLADQYLVDKLPTIVVIDGKTAIFKAAGVAPVEKLKELLN